MAKEFPEISAPLVERTPTPFKDTPAPSEQETRARGQARLRRVRVGKLRAHRLQPEGRHADENVLDLMESIRAIGLQEPPLVRRMPDGTYTILAGHRRVRAWQLLALAGEAEEKVVVFVLDSLTKLDELMIIAAESFHRQTFAPDHTANVVSELWEAWKDELGREPSRRELARALPWGRTWVSAHVKLHEAMKSTEIADRVQRLDNPDMSVLYSVLGIEDFASKLHALDVFIEKGSEAAKRAIPKKGRAGSREKPGRPAQVVTKRKRKDGRIELGIRYRPNMTAAEARTALDAMAEFETMLRALADGSAEPDSAAEPSVAS